MLAKTVSALALVAVFCLVLLVAACGGEEPSQGLEDFRGRPVFINYWAEWCQPCREEIPALNRFQHLHASQIQVLGYNFDGVEGPELERQTESLGIQFPSLMKDPRQHFGLPAASGIPETLVIDAEGNLFHRLQGPQTLDALEKILQEMEAQSLGSKTQ